MSKRIQVEPGYSVEPRSVTLEDGEQLCPDCRGTGKVVHVYGQFHNTYGSCWTCHGEGKIAFCAACGEQRPAVKHADNYAWMDALCLPCIRTRLDATTAEPRP